MGTPKGRLELTWMGKDQALIPSEHGKYDYDWVNSNDPRACELKPINILGTYGEGPEENLLITGDSGDALRTLAFVPEWADRYRNKVKLVYIDPPFNTDQAFDHYADSLEHSVWLTLMRDRLISIKELLADDGSVWVHLDDAEVHRMRCLLDEIFGAQNFVASVIWEKVYSPRMDSKQFSSSHDTILIYSKTLGWHPNGISVTADTAQFGKIDETGRAYRSRQLRKDGKGSARKDRPNMWFPVDAPDGTQSWPLRSDNSEGRWRWGKETYELRKDELEWLQTPQGLMPYVKQYADSSNTRPPETLWRSSVAGHNHEAQEHIKSLFDGAKFSTPKPERLLQRILAIATAQDDIVLDCFAGSGTTAAVAHKMGRRWVTVELQQETTNEFIEPRLRKVVAGVDHGGISTSTVMFPDDDLPASVTIAEAKAAVSLLAKFEADTDVPEQFKAVLKDLRKRTKATTVTETLWVGGGGFTTAAMSPSMYEVIDGDIYLTEVATNGAFSKAITGQLRYRHTPNDPTFCGIKGRSRLAVIDGVADENVIRSVLQNLGDGQKALVVAKIILPAAAELLHQLSPGSRIRRAPDDLFAKGTVK